MRVTLAILVVSLSMSAVAFCDNLSFEPQDVFGYSSDDFGGSSYLGVDTRDVTNDRLGALKLKEEAGVEITMVDQDAPAGKAGLKEHDVILTVNGTKLESVEQLRRMIHETPPGRIVSLGVSRSGQPLTVKVQLADRGKKFAFTPPARDFNYKVEVPPIPPIPPMPDFDVPVNVVVVHSSQRSGLMVENLTPQLGDYFGTKNGKGILVRSVEKGSRAEKAGFRAGDVIIKINGESVSDSSDFSHLIRGRKDNSVKVGILRDKKEQTITLTLPQRNESKNVFEETWEVPEFDADVDVNLANLNVQLAQIQPNIQLAMREMQKSMAANKKTFAQQQKKLQQQLKQQQEELKKELLKTQKQLDISGEDREKILNEIHRELGTLNEI